MRKIAISVLFLLLAQVTFASSNWGYVREAGPANWGKTYPLCLMHQQSPINITDTSINANNKLEFHYKPSDFKFVLNPHNLYVIAPESNKDYVEFNGTQYKLLSFHFHVPSEHTIKGKAYPMEMHIVHKSSKGRILEVSVFLQTSADKNMNIREIYVQPIKNGKMTTQTNLAKLIPAGSKYFTYSGSITTPPCTEGVTWIVMENPIPITEKQIQFFKDNVIPANNRPVQPLNGREVMESQM